jgi:hypothetical protein
VLQVEANVLYMASGTDVVVADGGTGASTLLADAVLLGNGTTAIANTGVGAANTVLRGTAAAPTFGTIDATYIDNRTRSLFIPATSFYSGIDAFEIGTFPNSFVGITMTGLGTATTAVATLVLPKDYVTSGAVTWKVLYTNSGVSANNVHWDLYYQIVGDAEDMTGANDVTMIGDDGPGTVADGLNIYSIGTTNTSLASNDVLRLSIQRDSGNAGDTNVSNMIFVGLQLDYTADS